MAVEKKDWNTLFSSTRKWVLFSVEENSVVLGFVLFDQTDEENIHVSKILVVPKNRQKGLGKKLMNFAFDYFRGKKKVVSLEVSVNNRDAICFYENLKFNATHIKKKYYFDGSDALNFTKDLSH